MHYQNSDQFSILVSRGNTNTWYIQDEAVSGICSSWKLVWACLWMKVRTPIPEGHPTSGFLLTCTRPTGCVKLEQKLPGEPPPARPHRRLEELGPPVFFLELKVRSRRWGPLVPDTDWVLLALELWSCRPWLFITDSLSNCHCFRSRLLLGFWSVLRDPNEANAGPTYRICSGQIVMLGPRRSLSWNGAGQAWSRGHHWASGWMLLQLLI